MNEQERLELEAFHDGELHGFARLRFQRRLRGDPRLRAELEALETVSRWIAEVESAPARRAAAPDLWREIAGALPAMDAQVADEAARPPGAPVFAARSVGSARLATWFRRSGVAAAALAATAAVALAVVLRMPDDPGGSEQFASGGTVRYLDTSGRAVLVIEQPELDLTILWMIDEV